MHYIQLNEKNQSIQGPWKMSPFLTLMGFLKKAQRIVLYITYISVDSMSIDKSNHFLFDICRYWTWRWRDLTSLWYGWSCYSSQNQELLITEQSNNTEVKLAKKNGFFLGFLFTNCSVLRESWKIVCADSDTHFSKVQVFPGAEKMEEGSSPFFLTTASSAKKKTTFIYEIWVHFLSKSQS